MMACGAELSGFILVRSSVDFVIYLSILYL